MSEIKVYKNDYVPVTFTIKSGGIVQDLTNTSVYFKVFDTEEVCTISDTETGVCTFELNPSNFTKDKIDTTYYLIWEWESGKKRAIYKNVLKVV
jgi:hypothetical protein